MIWAAAALAYDRGVDGFGLCEGAWSSNGWPWTDAEYQTLRLLGHPDLLATADKLYRARSLASESGSPKDLFPLGGPLLPLALAKGELLDMPLRMFADEHLAEHRAGRDPVAPARPPAEVTAKKAACQTDGGYEVQSFSTLLGELGTQCRNLCEFGEGKSIIHITKTTEPTPLQFEAFRLLQQQRSQ